VARILRTSLDPRHGPGISRARRPRQWQNPPVTLRLGVLEGDGIGPEIVPAAIAAADAALRRANTAVQWVPLPVGLAAIAAHGSALPPSTVEALQTLDGWVMGPHDNASYPPAHRATLNPSGALRKHFDLYANIRPARTFRNVPATVRAADLVIVRENTEGFYADRNTFAGTGEFMPTADVAITMGVFTRGRIERIAHAAFQLAGRRRRHVTIVHKANVLAATAFFRDICREAGERYPGIALDDVHVDAMAAHLVRRPADFDVIVTENMFGDILSDLAGELTGSLGLAASLNASDRTAMAQAAHGSAPDIAGQGIANPSAMILSTAMLLEWLAARHDDARLADAASRLAAAVDRTLGLEIFPRDLGGAVTTAAFTRAVIAQIFPE